MGPRRSSLTCEIRKRSRSAESRAQSVIPLPELADRLSELDQTASFVVHCKSGVRSAKAIGIMQAAGFSRLKNLSGGILAWIKEVDPSLPTY